MRAQRVAAITGPQAEARGPLRGEAAGEGVGSVRDGVEAGADVGKGGVERGKEGSIGEAAPLLAEHGLVASGAYAALEKERVGGAGENGRDPVAVFDEAEGGVEDWWVDTAEVQDLAPKPFAGIVIAAFFDVMGPHLAS